MEQLKKARWLWMLAALLSIAVLAFAACEDEEEEEGPGETPAAGERIQGGELTVASVEPDSLDPHFSSFSQDISLARKLWRGLYTLDRDNVPQPSMAAAAPEISEDGTVYTITLREGLQWSDGDDLLAEDFVMGILRTCNPDNAGEYQYVLTNVVGCDDHYGNEAGFDQALEDLVGVRAIDDTTLEITVQEAQPTFGIILSLWMTFPAPVHLFPNSSDPWPDPGPGAPGQLAYNGPYVLTEYNPGDSLVLEPNPNWAAPNDISPTLDQITSRFIDDFAVADNAFRTGEVDFANADEAQLTALIAEFEPTGEYVGVIFPGTVGLEMQMEDPTLGDPETGQDVRLALTRAIDRAQLNEVCFGDGRVPTTSWVPEVSGGAAPDAYDDVIGFDEEAARQHLADAGFPDGEGFPTLSILVNDRPDRICNAEFLQENYRTILNIETEVEVVDTPTRSARFTSEDFQLFPGGWIQDYPDPENWVLGQFDTGGSLNNFNCSDPEIDEKVEQARFNTNETERLQLYSEINELIVTRACGIGVTLHLANHYLIKPNVVGMAENATGLDGAIAGDWIAEAWGLSE
jgi:oligopeptide transport system substrate-binding protein